MKKDSNKSFVKRNVGGEKLNDSKSKKQTTIQKKLDMPYIQNALRSKLKNSNIVENTKENDSCNVRTYEGDEEMKVKDRRERKIEEQYKTTGSKVPKKAVPRFYVREAEFSNINKSNDVQDTRVPNVTWADIVNKGKPIIIP